MSKLKFNPGKIAATETITSTAALDLEFASFVSQSMKRHITGDWGDLDMDDKALNDEALLCPVEKVADVGSRIFSAYNVPKQILGLDEEKIYIITEYDRSVTTILFPSEY